MELASLWYDMFKTVLPNSMFQWIAHWESSETKNILNEIFYLKQKECYNKQESLKFHKYNVKKTEFDE